MILTVMVFLAFAAATGAVLAVAMVVRDLRRPDEALQRRLGLATDGFEPGAVAGLPAEGSTSRIDRSFYRLVEGSGTRLDPPTALALVAGLAIVGAAVPLVLFESLPAAFAGTVLGAALPICWWGFWQYRRLRAMQKGLPETLELVADSIRAGQTLEQAAELVAVQAPQPLGTEFGYCASQLKLGHSPLAVLQRMARRVPLPEFKVFATAVLVHRQTGGNLALLADRLACSARDRGEFLGHVRAVTAGSRVSVIGLTAGTLIALGILAWLRPEYLGEFLSHPMGPGLLMVAAALQIVGIVWVWRVLKVHF